MSRNGDLFVDDLRFINRHSSGEDCLFVSIEKNELCITTTREPENTQHDFLMSKDEWDLFKRIIDMQFKKEGEG